MSFEFQTDVATTDNLKPYISGPMQLISTIFVSLIVLLLLVYALLIGYYHRIWGKIPDQSAIALPDFDSGSAVRNDHLLSPVKVSVIIPARNEEDHIGHCLS